MAKTRAHMPHLLILWHSRTGGSAAMAQVAAIAAREDIQTVLLEATAASPDDLLAADGYLFVCPENLAALTGEMKALLDRCYYPLLGRIEGRPYAMMICAGTDGDGAARQLSRIVTGWRLKLVADPLIIRTGAQTPDAILAPKQIAGTDLDRCRMLARTLAAGLALGVF